MGRSGSTVGYRRGKTTQSVMQLKAPQLNKSIPQIDRDYDVVGGTGRSRNQPINAPSDFAAAGDTMPIPNWSECRGPGLVEKVPLDRQAGRGYHLSRADGISQRLSEEKRRRCEPERVMALLNVKIST